MVPAVQIAMPTSRAVTIRSTSTGAEGATIYVEGNSRIVIKDSGKIVGIAIKKNRKGRNEFKGKRACESHPFVKCICQLEEKTSFFCPKS